VQDLHLQEGSSPIPTCAFTAGGGAGSFAGTGEVISFDIFVWVVGLKLDLLAA